MRIDFLYPLGFVNLPKHETKTCYNCFAQIKPLSIMSRHYGMPNEGLVGYIPLISMQTSSLNKINVLLRSYKGAQEFSSRHRS